MKLLLINQPMFNRGDESAHKALVYGLLQNFPDCTIEVLFVGRPQNAVDECKVNDTRVKYTNLPSTVRYRKTYIWNLKHGLRILWPLNPTVRKIIRLYRSADWIISSPGDKSLGSRYDWDHLFFVSLAEYIGCRVAYYGRSIGPFPADSPIHERFNWLSRRALRKASFISLRDFESQRIAKDLRLDFLPTLDTAFLYTPMVQIPGSVREAIGDGEYIVLVPNYLIRNTKGHSGHAAPYQVKLFFTELGCRILEKFPSCKLVLLPQLFCGANYADADYHFFKDIEAGLNDERVVVLPDTLSSEYHQAIIAGSKCVVGARYHSIVFAINNNVPFVAMSYENRILGMLQAVDKQDRLVDITLALDPPRGRKRLSESKVTDLSSVSLTFEAEVALARILDKMDILEKDEKAMEGAKFLTSQCFEIFVDILRDSENRKKNRSRRK